MPYPGVRVKVTSGNLLRSISVVDGIGAVAATAATPENIGVVRQVFSLQDAENKGYTLAAEPFIHGFLSVFYGELGGNQLLYVLGTPETMTMADVVNSTNVNGLMRILSESGGDTNLIAVVRKPSAGYNAGAGFLDADVEQTVLSSLPICQAAQNRNTPMRLFIEGRVANQNVANTFKPNTANNGFVSVVLGGTSDDGSAAVALALARACKFAAHVKLGSGQNGALTAGQIYIGSERMEERLDMEQLHDQGFLTFQRRPGAAGYYFGVDNMADSGDFRIQIGRAHV